MFTRNLGSSDTRMSVALPLADCRRHTNPGEDSASALIRSSAAMKSASSGLPGGATARPTFNCATCHEVIRSLRRRRYLLKQVLSRSRRRLQLRFALSRRCLQPLAFSDHRSIGWPVIQTDVRLHVREKAAQAHLVQHVAFTGANVQLHDVIDCVMKRVEGRC